MSGRSSGVYPTGTKVSALTPTAQRYGALATTSWVFVTTSDEDLLTIFAIVYNLVRLVMRQSATLQHTAVERISFLDALRWLSAPQTGMPLVALIVNPIRPHRVEPRVKERRPKSLPFTIKPRQELRQQSVQQGLRG